jgi:hypothetical protein
VVVAADHRQVAHPNSLSSRGERVEVCTCMDSGVGPHISTPPQRGGGEGDGRWKRVERPVSTKAGHTLSYTSYSTAAEKLRKIFLKTLPSFFFSEVHAHLFRLNSNLRDSAYVVQTFATVPLCYASFESLEYSPAAAYSALPLFSQPIGKQNKNLESLSYCTVCKKQCGLMS